MRDVRIPVSVASVLALLNACAYPIETTTRSADEKRAEFDYAIYLTGIVCGSEGGPYPTTLAGCPKNGLRRLAERFAERSRSYPLEAYFSDNGASCHSLAGSAVCTYEKKIIQTPLVWGRQVNPSREERFVLTVTFPKPGHDIAPDEIQVGLKRFTRGLADMPVERVCSS